MPLAAAPETSSSTPPNPRHLVNIEPHFQLAAPSSRSVVPMYVRRVSAYCFQETRSGVLIWIQSPDGNRIALALETGQIYIFDARALELTTTWASHAMSIRTLSWSPDSSVRGLIFTFLLLHPLTLPRIAPSIGVRRQAFDTT